MMLKLTRLCELFGFGVIPVSDAATGGRVFRWRHQHKRNNQLQLRWCSSAQGEANASPTTSTLAREGGSTETVSKEQWPPVSLARCGIAKEFSGPANDLFGQQRQGNNVFGDDACFIATYKSTYAAGVADGVGGWRSHGIDPSKFSSQLMANCAEIVRNGDFLTERPDLIIARAFNQLKITPRPVGSSTACVVVVNERTLYAANLGDSGYLICRAGKVVFRSPEQTHYFNAPYQLALLPERFGSPTYKKRAEYIGDSPERSDLRAHKLQSGDLVLIASDGLWDNLYDEKIAELLNGIEATEASLQARCNTLALIARHYASDQIYESPFAKRARECGVNAPGGKPDDVTIIMIHVS